MPINRFSKFFYCQNQETICNETVINRSHQTWSVSLHYLVKCRMMHSSWRCHWPVAWSTMIEPAWHVAPKQPRLKSSRLCCTGFFSTNGLSMLTIHDSQPAKESHCRWVGQCRSVWLIAPLVSGVAGFDAKSSSKAGTLKIWCENYEMWFLDNNWDNKHVVSVVNFFFKCVVTKVVLF